MTTCAFDTLLDALQNAVVGANGSIRRRREALFAADAAPHDTSEHALRVEMPQGPAPTAPCVAMTLPLRLFRDRRMPSIAMLSIEFDCTFRFLSRRGSSSRELHMLMGKPRFPWLSRRPLHHVRISYLSTNAWCPQVEIDSRPLVMPAVADATGG
jgi:hypothetical protein